MPDTRDEPDRKSVADRVGRVGRAAADVLERARDRFDERFRADRPLDVVPFRGYAGDTTATVSARVLVRGDPPDGDPDSLRHRLRAGYRRFVTDEAPGVRVRLRAGEGAGAVDIEAETDDEGFVRFDFASPPRSDDVATVRTGDVAGGEAAVAPDGDGAAGFEVLLTLPDEPEAPTMRTSVVRPGAEARFGILSDVDDTVLATHVQSKPDLLRLSLMETSATRVAFPGVAELYRALAGRHNPIYYVSASPWNLYEFLEDFMRREGLPHGPLMLRDLGTDQDRMGAGAHDDHKLDAARDVLDRNPELPFVLIGDDSQTDPETFATLVDDYPGRILAVWIRNVSDAPRADERSRLVEALGDKGVEMLLMTDSADAARHAVRLGLIDASDVAAVEAAVADDALPENLVEPARA